MTELLSYDVTRPMTKRSFVEEWAPHARQSAKSFEWWYMTATVHDAQGNPYFLYIGVPDHVGDVMQTRLMGATLPHETRTVPIAATLSDYNADIIRTPGALAVLPGLQMFDFERNRLTLDDGRGTRLDWDYVGDRMSIHFTCPQFDYDFTLTNALDGLWHQDSLGHEGLIQEGAEGDLSFYYSLPNCDLSGSISIKDAAGRIERTFNVYGRSWVDRQWGDFTAGFWEWSSFRFENGATLHLYNFFNGRQEGLYRAADGTVHNFDSVVVKQNGYAKSPISDTWVSWGWSYEFPIEIEGSRRYTVEPWSNKEFFGFPDMVVDLGDQVITGFSLYEGAGTLINDETGKVVGVSVNESADIRVMENGPYAARQR
jgi:hypothetical protein